MSMARGVVTDDDAATYRELRVDLNAPQVARGSTWIWVMRSLSYAWRIDPSDGGLIAT